MASGGDDIRENELKETRLEINRSNIIQILISIDEFIKKAIINGNFNVSHYYSDAVHIEVCDGLHLFIQMDNRIKRASIRDPKFQIHLSDREESTLYNQVIGGGLSQAIKAKEDAILQMKNEISLMIENHKKLSVTVNKE